MTIFPAIDIIEGKCVRLSKGDYATKKVYNENPLEVAKRFEAHGITHLHLVDLDGAKSKHIVNHKILEQITGKTALRVDFGGGLKTDEDLRIAFECGANQITGGSIAVKNPEVFEGWIEKFGSEKIILGADARNENVAVSGWTEESEEKLLPFIQNYLKKGIKYVICTDISKDGMLEGPAFDLYRKIIKNGQKPAKIRSNLPAGRQDRHENTENNEDSAGSKLGKNQLKSTESACWQAGMNSKSAKNKANSSLKLIASGGISKFDELPKLAEIGCEGVIIGKAIYENRISLKQLERFILQSDLTGFKNL